MKIFQEDRLVARLLSLLSPGLRRQDRTRKHQEKPLIEVVEDTGHSIYLQDTGLHKNQDAEDHNQNHFQISQDKVWKSERWFSRNTNSTEKRHCETWLSPFWILERLIKENPRFLTIVFRATTSLCDFSRFPKYEEKHSKLLLKNGDFICFQISTII